jgi:uracil-DNA glycosylase
MPSGEEREQCRPWLERTFEILPVKVIVALGGLAWRESLREVRRRGWLLDRAPKFGHGAKVRLLDTSAVDPSLKGRGSLSAERWLLGSYHPSRQNTHTRRLTEPMLDAVFATANSLLGET